jgi:hypothetical protein
MTLTVVNANDRYSHLALREPPATGYLYLAAVCQPTLGRSPLPRHSRRKTRLLGELKARAARLAALGTVSRATVYSAAVVPPPGQDARHYTATPARYDIAVLIETPTVDALNAVQDSDDYQQLRAALTEEAPAALTMPARCTRFLADVDKSRDGLFLFNHFITNNDPGDAARLWEHLAGWYAAETGMDNSTLLAPLGPCDYVFVNHARWDRHLARFTLQQLSKPSFRSYVQANLHANQTASVPILFHLA